MNLLNTQVANYMSDFNPAYGGANPSDSNMHCDGNLTANKYVHSGSGAPWLYFKFPV